MATKFTNTGRIGEVGVATVTLDGAGTGTVAVTFDRTYIGTPEIAVVQPTGGVDGTWSATSASKTGFTVSVTTSADNASQNVGVFYMVHELGIQA